MKRRKVNNWIILCVSTVIFSSCLRMGASGSRISRALETFYVEGGLTQYFIKPLYLKGDKTNVWMDFTYRHDPKKNNQVICNFSVKSNNNKHQVKNAYFSVGQEKITPKGLKKIVYSKHKSTYTFRYTSFLTYAELQKLAQNRLFNFVVATKNEQKFLHTPSSKTIKKLKVIDEKMISIIGLEQED